jgi:hypothetical protein
MPPVERIDGRRLFGDDPGGYDAARPTYPDWVFETLAERCGLAPGADIFEIGPGTGTATRPLLATRPGRLVAIEPDARLAAFLADTLAQPPLEIVNSTFEDAELTEGAFDLGVCATAFHWLDEAAALRRIASLLRPGRWWAAVWNIFGDPRRPDPFHEATKGVLGDLDTPSWRDRLPVGMDADARTTALHATSAFGAIAYRMEAWDLVLDADQTRALYATYSNINIRPDREAVLDEVAEVARDVFDGQVVRHMITSLYIARTIEAARPRG